jgi:hypothetical protein
MYYSALRSHTPYDAKVWYVLVADFSPAGRKIGNKRMLATTLPKAKSICGLSSCELLRLAKDGQPTLGMVDLGKAKYYFE